MPTRARACGAARSSRATTRSSQGDDVRARAGLLRERFSAARARRPQRVRPSGRSRFGSRVREATGERRLALVGAQLFSARRYSGSARTAPPARLPERRRAASGTSRTASRRSPSKPSAKTIAPRASAAAGGSGRRAPPEDEQREREEDRVGEPPRARNGATKRRDAVPLRVGPGEPDAEEQDHAEPDDRPGRRGRGGR